MSRNIIAVEVGGQSGELNLLGDLRDLTSWESTGSPVVAYNQTGLSGLLNTATYIEDISQSPSAFGKIASPIIHIEDSNILVVRLFVLKDAEATITMGSRLFIGGVYAVGFKLNTATGAVTLDGGSTSSQAGQATLVSFGGQDWWEFIYSGFGTLLEQDAFIEIFPSLHTIASVRSVAIGNVELYTTGGIDKTSSIAGTPPNYGEVFLSTEAFSTTNRPGLLGTYDYAKRAGMYNRTFDARLGSNINYKVMVAPHFWRRRTSIGLGIVEIINDGGLLDYWREIDWRDRPVAIKLHQSDADYQDAETLLNAIVERIDFTDEKRVRLIIRDPVPKLYEPINATYTIESPDTVPDAHFLTIPITFGDPKQCEPVLVNAATFEYHATYQICRRFERTLRLPWFPFIPLDHQRNGTAAQTRKAPFRLRCHLADLRWCLSLFHACV